MYVCVCVHMHVHLCMSAMMYVNELRKEDKRRNDLRLLFLNFSFFFLSGSLSITNTKVWMWLAPPLSASCVMNCSVVTKEDKGPVVLPHWTPQTSYERKEGTSLLANF